MIEVDKQVLSAHLDHAKGVAIRAENATHALQDALWVEAPASWWDESAARETPVELVVVNAEQVILPPIGEEVARGEGMRGAMPDRAVHHLHLELGREDIPPEVELGRHVAVGMSPYAALPVEGKPHAGLAWGLVRSNRSIAVSIIVVSPSSVSGSGSIVLSALRFVLSSSWLVLGFQERSSRKMVDQGSGY